MPKTKKAANVGLLDMGASSLAFELRHGTSRSKPSIAPEDNDAKIGYFDTKVKSYPDGLFFFWK
jgi:hypothetical protein